MTDMARLRQLDVPLAAIDYERAMQLQAEALDEAQHNLLVARVGVEAVRQSLVAALEAEDRAVNYGPATVVPAKPGDVVGEIDVPPRDVRALVESDPLLRAIWRSSP